MPPWRRLPKLPPQPSKNHYTSRHNSEGSRKPAIRAATKKTHLLAPKPTPAPEKLLVVSPVGPQPLHDTAPPPRVALSRPPPRVAKPLHPSPQSPSDTTPIKLLTRPNGPGVSQPRRPRTVPTARAAALTVTKAAPPRRSPRVADLNIKHQDFGEVEATSPVDNDKIAQPKIPEAKNLSVHVPKTLYSPVLTSSNTESVPKPSCAVNIQRKFLT